MWSCKSIHFASQNKDGGAGDIQKHEYYWNIYDSLIQIGKKINEAIPQGKSQIAMKTREAASEHMPSPEEIKAVTTSEEMTINEYVELYFVPPDIYLESERVWPPEPDYVY